MEKKIYTTPTVTSHGKAEVKTLGPGGRLLELIDWRRR